MRVISVLAATFIAIPGASSVAQSATIDFGFGVITGAITYTGATLQGSNALNLGGAALEVSQVRAIDGSGLTLGDSITISPTVDYGSGEGPLTLNIVVSWSDVLGNFKETLTTLDDIMRGTNDIGFVFGGTVTGPPGSGFVSTPAELDLVLNQAGGPGNVVSASLTNFASTVPEPSTWVMMGLGFTGLHYAIRRRAKDRKAFAI
jgi:hypothetical protein